MAALLAGVLVDILAPKGLSDNVMYLLMTAIAGFGVANVGAHAVHVKTQENNGPDPEVQYADSAKISSIEGIVSGVEDQVDKLVALAEAPKEENADDPVLKAVLNLAKQNAVISQQTQQALTLIQRALGANNT